MTTAPVQAIPLSRVTKHQLVADARACIVWSYNLPSFRPSPELKQRIERSKWNAGEIRKAAVRAACEERLAQL